MPRHNQPKWSKGFRKFIRGQKSRIRNTARNEEEVNERMQSLRTQFGNRHE